MQSKYHLFKYFFAHLQVLFKISSLKILIHKQVLLRISFTGITQINSQTLLKLTSNLTLNEWQNLKLFTDFEQITKMLNKSYE